MRHRRKRILAFALALFVTPAAADANDLPWPWELAGFSADGRVAIFDNYLRSAVKLVFADTGTAITIDLDIRRAAFFLPRWGRVWGRDFSGWRSQRHERYDELRSGRQFFAVRDGVLSLYDHRRKLVSLPGTTTTRLGYLNAVIGPGGHFIVLLRRIACYQWGMSALYRSDGGKLSNLSEVARASEDPQSSQARRTPR